MNSITYNLRALLTLFASLLLAACSGGSDNNTNKGANPTISSNLGMIQGVERNGANEYRGIPYAQPLNSTDRWTLAKPVRSWSGVLNAKDFGSACPQQARFGLTEESLNEDCLTLNVSTPSDIADNETLPVMLWFPGGGFVGGSSNLYRLDKLASEGRIIVVTANYRVGALGFMAHPSLSNNGWNGNLGLEDQRLAMQWVKDNIGAFRGDNTKITIAGESAGSASTCLHVLSKSKVEGLFRQALALSYNCLYEWPTLQNSLARSNLSIDGSTTPVFQRMSSKLGCNRDNPIGSNAELSCMRNKPLKDLLEAQGQVADEVPLFPFAPVIGSGSNGTLPLADWSSNEIKANLYKVPMLYGGAKDELRLYVGYDVLLQLLKDPNFNPNALTTNNPFVFGNLSANPPTLGQFDKYYALASFSWYGKFQAIIDEYQLASGTITADTLGSIFSDYTPVVGLNNCTYLRTAKAFSELMPLYQWEFADPNALVLGVGIPKGQDPKMALGSVHSSALNYIFPNLSNTSAIDAPDLPAVSQRLSNKMVQSWANFVKSGSPETSEIKGWPRFNQAADSKKVMLFGPNEISLYDANIAHRCDFWRGLDSNLTPLNLN